MVLPSSGQISINQIHVEAGGSSGTQVKLSDTDVKGLINANTSIGNIQFSEYYGAAASNTTSSIAGGGSTTTNQFANCNVSLSTGNKLVVIIPMYRVQSASSIANAPTSVTVGGQSATQHIINNTPNTSVNTYGHINSIWVLETTLSGTQLVTGSTATGTGNNSCIVYEITGHTSATPMATASISNYSSSAATARNINLSSQASGGTVVFGCTATGGTLTASNSIVVSNNTFSNLNHGAGRLDGTSGGSFTYTWTNSVSGYFNIVAASFR